MTTLRQGQVTIDCRNPPELAAFWAAALEWTVESGASQFAARVAAPSGTAGCLPLLFLQVPEPKTGKTRIHVDHVADDLQAELDRLLGLGATLVHEKREWGIHWFTLLDPEGNEFCVGNDHDTASEDAGASAG